MAALNINPLNINPGKPATPVTPVPTQSSFTASPLGVAVNTVLGLFTPKPYLDVAKDIGNSFASFAQSAGEAVPRLFANVPALPAKTIPGLDFLGPVQSFQSQAIERSQAGAGTAGNIAQASLDTILSEPLGVGLKPAFLLAGLIDKKLITGAAQQFFDFASKTDIPEQIAAEAEKVFKGIGADKAKLMGERYAAMTDPLAIKDDFKNVLNEAAKIATPPELQEPEIPHEPPLPPSIAELLSERDKADLARNVVRGVESKDEAAISSREFNQIIDQNDHKVVDKYNELLIRQRLSGKALAAAPGNTRIAEKVKQTKEEIAQLEPLISNIKLRGGILDDVPVVPENATDAIDALVNPSDVRYTFKDITGLKGQFRDMTRNFEQFFGKNFPEFKQSVVDPFNRSKGEFVDEISMLADELEAKVTKKFGIERGSEADAAIQDWGERGLAGTEDMNPKSLYHDEIALVKKFGEEKAAKIQEAAAWFRKQYDSLLDEVNAIRKEIYPNNPEKLVAKRKDYFRHYRELGDSISGLMSLLEEPSGINPNLVGTSGFTQPKTKFLPFAQLREGPRSERSAVGGYINYIPQFAYAKHIDPQIGVFRYLRRKLAENAPRAGSSEGGKRQKGIDNMLQYLTDFSNDLAGKTNPMERWIQNTIPGGRTTFKVMDWTNKRVKTNTVLGNASSLLAQFFNLPLGIASAKQYMVPGMARTLGSIFVDNAPMAKSTFLKERYLEPLTNRFKLSWFDHPFKASTQNSKNFAGWALGALDEVSSRLIWNAHYEKFKSQNKGASVEQAVDFADDATKKVVGGRGIGEVPLGQKAKVFQMIAPFQIEVGNAMWALGEHVSRKDLPALALYAISAYYLNNVYKSLTGNRGIFDPIQSVMEGTTSLAQEWENGEYLRGLEKFGGRQVGELLANVPLGQTVANLLHDNQGKIPLADMTAGEFFGQSGVGRNPTNPLISSAVSDPLFKLLLPFGGNQLKKTLGGIQDVSQGRAKTADNKTKYRIQKNAPNFIQGATFGKYALPEAQRYYQKKDDALSGTKKKKTSRISI